MRICKQFIIFKYDNNKVIKQLDTQMNKNQRQADAVKVTATPTEKAETKGLTVLMPGNNPQAEDTTAEVIEPKKAVLNLAETMKLVEELHMKKRHRDRLEVSIDELESFEIKQKDEDLGDKSYYTGCHISIKDDNRTEFLTKNPAIIAEVVNFLKQKFSDKLTEIEALIVLPH